MKVLSFGEILWDVYPDVKHLGGASLNFACHLAKHNEQAYMLSSIGNDDYGTEAKQILESFGVRTDYVGIIDGMQTGKCLVTLDQNSIPKYNLLQNVTYDRINCQNIPDVFDVLYFGTLAQRSEYNFNSLNELLKTHSFSEIFVDVNIRPPFYSEKTVRFGLENATIVKISDEEMPFICELLKLEISDYKELAIALSDIFKNLKCIIITLGDKGAYAYDCKNKASGYCESKKVPVVSTVGAGDSFSAAFLHKYMNGLSIDAALEYASRVAAFVVANKAAVPQYDCNSI